MNFVFPGKEGKALFRNKEAFRRTRIGRRPGLGSFLGNHRRGAETAWAPVPGDDDREGSNGGKGMKEGDCSLVAKGVLNRTPANPVRSPFFYAAKPPAASKINE
ncbi:hypothetical protein SDC9_12034 [bioreactor metagenome]|uniref:Uncharacterized protein n=1 Tax=bioreactor metagenome TaxID=1076179 RepID=A0A644TKW5_9ZZZZ